ncbi:MAG: hypothetical protein K0S45_3052 [Nitrospira sp.]|jgi:hypothetical protein|nr:hypothetical protein [Nitrospira sp.]
MLSDLAHLQLKPSAELSFLLGHCKRIDGVLKSERSRLLPCILDDDPVQIDCDLFGSLGINTLRARSASAEDS